MAWNITDEAVELAWKDSDQDAVTWLLKQTYQISDQGYLDVPALKLDEKGQYTFTQGVLTTFLQHNTQRELESTAVTRTFSIDPGSRKFKLM